ncbi:MAG: UDP-N-acetylglucosamine 2-epimerase (non-hydrolyzing) [Verrucomicrobia bacterium]|nr:MAG: UDP-N-acetylglucosamine 2-epimerase (non-hydrolyzing) [Verrucomicrobiota bacterium]
MKVLTVFGTRPEIIRLSVITRLLARHCEQILVHTGQNYDPNLSDLFLKELEVGPINHHLGIQTSRFGAQAGQILARMDDLMDEIKPDRLLILGDTNSGLSAIVAARKGIPVFHLEAGNRCFDNRVPEEVNRRIIDHSSDILLPYTNRSAENLVREGIRRERIFVVGNPILEVLQTYGPQIAKSNILEKLNLQAREYFLVTMHRAENVDPPERLQALVKGLSELGTVYGKPVIVSVHPRTADRIRKLGANLDTSKLRLEQPFGLFDFVHLEKNALGIVSDSGTVQEEACIFGIPNVTIRDVTERPETLECGSNFLSGSISTRLKTGMELSLASAGRWQAPAEYRCENTSVVVAKIVLGYTHALSIP